MPCIGVSLSVPRLRVALSCKLSDGGDTGEFNRLYYSGNESLVAFIAAFYLAYLPKVISSFRLALLTCLNLAAILFLFLFWANDMYNGVLSVIFFSG